MKDVLMMADVGFQIFSENVSITLRSRDYKSAPIVIWEESDEDTDHIHLGQPERMDMGRVGAEDACVENCDARQVGDMCGGGSEWI